MSLESPLGSVTKIYSSYFCQCCYNKKKIPKSQWLTTKIFINIHVQKRYSCSSWTVGQLCLYSMYRPIPGPRLKQQSVPNSFCSYGRRQSAKCEVQSYTLNGSTIVHFGFSHFVLTKQVMCPCLTIR